jgi:hypothetical protein
LRIILRLLTTATVAVLLASAAAGQPPDVGKKEKGSKGPPDEDKAILSEIREAYKAPFEVHEDVLKQLRKSYGDPSPAREDKIVRELRRLYQLSPDQEAVVVREVRSAVAQPSAAAEDRFFRLVDKMERLPEGTVPATVQAEQLRKLFGKLDANGDGVLSTGEMPEPLRADRGRWDANRDGVIDQTEYEAYYRGRLRHLSEQVTAGQIDLKLKRGGPTIATTTHGTESKSAGAEEPRPAVARAGKLPKGLPDWFVQLDADGDGQVGLYEWKASGRPIAEFTAIDRNGDGLVTPDEMLRYLAEHPDAKAAVTSSGKSKK